MDIKILDQKQLLFTELKGVKFAQLSDLAYEKASQKLYLVGDKGALFTFHAIFSDKIERIEPEDAVNLQDRHGKRLRHWKRDSEGLTLDKAGTLFISFEGEANDGSDAEAGQASKKSKKAYKR